jgi:hypothetical protein
MPERTALRNLVRIQKAVLRRAINSVFARHILFLFTPSPRYMTMYLHAAILLLLSLTAVVLCTPVDNDAQGTEKRLFTIGIRPTLSVIRPPVSATTIRFAPIFSYYRAIS